MSNVSTSYNQFFILNIKYILIIINLLYLISIRILELPTFLFWRAFLLIQMNKNSYNLNRLSSHNIFGSSKWLPEDKSNDKNKDEYPGFPIKVMFGRPNFKELFRSFINPNSKEFFVYSTTSPPVNEAIFDSAWWVSKETGIKFHHIYEATS